MTLITNTDCGRPGTNLDQENMKCKRQVLSGNNSMGMIPMDDVMQGQLARYEKDLVRWNIPKDQILRKVEAKQIELEGLRKRVNATKSTPFSGPHIDTTFGKSPWLPLCDVKSYRPKDI